MFGGMFGLKPAAQIARNTGILGAVQRDNVESLKGHLRSGRQYGLDDLARALHVAADRDYEECARILLEAKALPNIHDASGYTPLITAARKGSANVLRLLIDANSNLNRATYRIRATALHWAATNGHADCVKMLLEAGANPQALTIHGRTPLMMAARCNHVDIVRDLMAAGAGVKTRDYCKSTALHMAAEEGCTDCIDLLLNAGAEIDAQMKNGDTPIMRAASRGQAEAMRILLRRNCDLEKRGHHLTALHWAADGGDCECLQVVLDAGIDPNVETHDSYYGADLFVNPGVTPLMLAARKGHAEACRFLIRYGAEVDRLDDVGYSALLYAVKYNYGHCALVLIKYGADPDGTYLKPNSANPVPEKGILPVFLALKENSVDAFAALLKANCNLDVIFSLDEKQYVGPFDLALAKGHIDQARMILLAGFDKSTINTALLESAMAWLLQVDEDLGKSLMEQLRSPLLLMQLSRQCIRQCLGRKVLETLPLLPLPLPLINYLGLQDLDDFI